jgi:hypothetical protein
MRNNKKDSYMGDVGIIRKIDDIPWLKEKLIETFDEKCHSHIDISRYGLLLANHILELTNTPMDDSIAEVFAINQKWQAGEVRFQAARDVAGMILDLAREEKDPVKGKVYRVLGQVAAIPHVKRHALIASDYAITLINVMYPKNMEEVKKEREIQISMMQSV